MPKTKYLVMLSSSFEDLREHRQAALEAMRDVGLEPINMEHRPQPPSTNTLHASLKMVDEADGFVGIVSHRYGSIHADANGHSLSEAEYRRALERGIRMSMFVMSNEHLVRADQTESSEEGRAKLAAWKGHVSQTFTYSRFDSLDDFRRRIRGDLEALRNSLDESSGNNSGKPRNADPHLQSKIVRAPELLAMPAYAPGHEFVGRTRELILLDDWAKEPDAPPVLLFEAIGGMGKSMLTWHWVRTRARGARPDFAGIFWYSFYERGAETLDFVRHALAYVTGRAVEEFRERKTRSITTELLPIITRQPWLFVLDGVERLLVAYHRVDAAQVRDEEINETEDPSADGGIWRRDARECISEDDQALLTQLAQCGSSKILMTSRVTPNALLNRSGDLRPGVRCHRLIGLDPRDAESIVRKSGAVGDGEAIQLYLQKHFDCHPLVVGVVAGLVRNYRQAPGNFQAWVDDPEAGAAPHLSKWDLIQRRNHILQCAFADLRPEQRTLLAYLALISEASDFETVSALNPYQPSVQASKAPKRRGRSENMPDGAQAAEALLTSALTDLERRGLLQWNRSGNTYDLHPVVRSYVFDMLDDDARNEASARVANHFEKRPDPPYERATALNDLRHGLNVYRALIAGRRYDRAFDVFREDLDNALFINLRMPREVLVLLRPLFPQGWNSLPQLSRAHSQIDALNLLGYALYHVDDFNGAQHCFEAMLTMSLESDSCSSACLALANLFNMYLMKSIATAERCAQFALRLAKLLSYPDLYRAKKDLIELHLTRGAFNEAQNLIEELGAQPMPKDRGVARPGELEALQAEGHLAQGRLDEAETVLRNALNAATQGHNRLAIVGIWNMFAKLHVARLDLGKAAEACETAIRMHRESEISPATELIHLALIRSRAGHHEEARSILAGLPEPDATATLAELYLELGELDHARDVAHKAFRAAWGDGPPYARHTSLLRAQAVLDQLGEPQIPLATFDPQKVPTMYKEDRVLAFIEEQERMSAETQELPDEILKPAE